MEASMRFDDLLDIRRGGEGLIDGAGPSWVAPLDTPEEWEAKAAALRELFSGTLGRAPDLACPLDLELRDERKYEGYVRRTYAYNVEPDERIEAYVLVPDGLAGKAPAMVCIQPTTEFGKEQAVGNEPSARGQDRAYALHLVQRGYVTISYDLMSAGRRCFPGLKHFDTAGFYEKHPEWSARGKDLWDLARAIDVLETVGEVDSERIGSIGHSQGGGITVHGMAMEPRLKVGVSSCGVWPMRLSKNPYNHARTHWWVGRPALRPYCLTGKPVPVDLHELMALAAPRPLMNQNALNDNQYSAEEEPVTRPALENLAANVRKVFELFGAGDNFQNILHLNGHGFIEAQRRPAYAFLEKHLRP